MSVDLDNLKDIVAPLFEKELSGGAKFAKVVTGYFEEAPGVRSVRRLVFLGTFLFGAGVCVAGFWLPISDQVKDITIAIVCAGSGTMLGGRIAEMFENRGEQ